MNTGCLLERILGFPAVWLGRKTVRCGPIGAEVGLASMGELKREVTELGEQSDFAIESELLLALSPPATSYICLRWRRWLGCCQQSAIHLLQKLTHTIA